MIKNLKVARIESQYCDYLRKYDNKVSYNKNEKELRPFVGLLFKINDCEYFAPLSSPKLKHRKMKNTIDFMKIQDGELGAVNFNNMIPVRKNNYSVINLNRKNLSKSELRYQDLLKDQYNWLNEHYNQVQNRSYRLYHLYNNKQLSESIASRCCNFKLLEEKCELYNN